jgi:hypothetical protein
MRYEQCQSNGHTLAWRLYSFPNVGEVNPALHHRFQVIIGSLMYLMIGTRPDISYAITKLSMFSANPLQEHLNTALHICRYLAGTRDVSQIYREVSGKRIFTRQTRRHASGTAKTLAHPREAPYLLQCTGKHISTGFGSTTLQAIKAAEQN